MRQRKGERLVKVVQRSAERPLLPGSTSCAALGFEAVKEGSCEEHLLGNECCRRLWSEGGVAVCEFHAGAQTSALSLQIEWV